MELQESLVEVQDKQDENSVCCCGCDGPCCECLNYILRLINFFVSYSLIYSVVSEILLLINIYSTDPLFFALSISFLIVPLLFGSVGAWMLGQELKISRQWEWCLYCPIINIAIVWSAIAIQKNTTADKGFKSMVSSFLAGLMTFPLYIINLSYLLENVDSFDDISIFNYAQLFFSFINLTITPIQMVADFLSHDFEFSTCKSYLLSTFYIYPMGLIEVIHFFPFLFLYYIDKQIRISQLAIVLFIFNIPKLLFVIHQARKAAASEAWHDCKVLGLILSILIFITVPLIPYIFMMINKDKAEDIVCICDDGYCSSVSKYYWNIVLYLLISYGVSTIYTIIIVGGLNQLSLQVQIAFGVFLVLIVVIIATLPISFYCIKNAVEKASKEKLTSEVEM